MRIVKIPYRHKSCYNLFILQLKKIDNGLASCLPACFRKIIDFNPVHFSLVREEKDVGMGACNKNVLYDVLVFCCCCDDSLAASVLKLVSLQRQPLYVAGVCYCYCHFLVFYQVLSFKLCAFKLYNLRSSWIIILFFQLA